MRKTLFGSNINESNIKIIIYLLVGILTVLFSSNKNKDSKKKKSVFSKIKRNSNITYSIIDRIYLNKLKKDVEDDYPIKLETAEIIDI